MSLGEHLVELRKRLTIAGIAILVGAVGGWFLSERLLVAITQPLLEIPAARQAVLNFGTITSSFDLRLQISLLVGIVITSPVWLFQILAFLVPGLSQKERRYILGFFFSAIPLFIGGVVAGWFIFPHMVILLNSFAIEGSTTILDAKYYYDFFIKLVLVIGIGFVLPVFVVLLNFLGVLSARSILKGWRVAVLVIALFCATATPAADPWSMLLLGAPMVALYFLSGGVAWLHDRRIAKRDAALAAEAEAL
ncbi:twin-arginine translocase subunit TatC [Glaciihabitans arcticus]|uniref:Sec-independent protein translocase protein TatC n=1 Tax=Glaciihabitans arcticus TaxID=2668039 RepID=A0A4Q9GPE0_9MICO|nr:twin-arginine translocase subunit TatC [Glaciihabitans arcticus]TBN56601.1 twin-arginine translocase subunit TatC [Glaciihabitans arcticus]